MPASPRDRGRVWRAPVCNENSSILWVTAARPSPASLRSTRSPACGRGAAMHST